MAELLLDSLEIKGYRCFEHLTIEKLGRVNLIVGKNNVGKTALLEALWIYANKAENHVLNSIVFDRNEVTNLDSMSHEGMRLYRIAFRNLFYNRPNLPNNKEDVSKNPYFILGEIGQKLVLTNGKLETLSEKELKNQTKTVVLSRFDHEPSLGMPLIKTFSSIKDFNSLFVKSSGLTNETILTLWDETELTPSEDKIYKILNETILSGLKRISVKGYPSGSSNRVPVVQISNEKEPLPIKTYGEGTFKLFGIALTLVNSDHGMLLIDEIESGLHYSILPDVWKLIFKTAKDLNVQVFATTHSKDCIEAFTQAAVDDEESEGMLIRLERRGENIIAKTIQEERLAQAINYDVEVR